MSQEANLKDYGRFFMKFDDLVNYVSGFDVAYGQESRTGVSELAEY